MTAQTWCVYLILCENASLYCGISPRPYERLLAHKAGKGAKYTRIHKPEAMRVVADGLSKSEALKQEIALKKMPAAKKRALWMACAAHEIEAV
ncbi:GIY-YIG nuclease family protein [Neisseria weixii]|uniref:GIY-YIG nuclease family protein n=1 Tax=Neisseria weixii TaxID=1853276 RepID=UPI0035A025F1